MQSYLLLCTCMGKLDTAFCLLKRGHQCSLIARQCRKWRVTYTGQAGVGNGLLWTALGEFHKELAGNYGTKLYNARVAYQDQFLEPQPDLFPGPAQDEETLLYYRSLGRSMSLWVCFLALSHPLYSRHHQNKCAFCLWLCKYLLKRMCLL